MFSCILIFFELCQFTQEQEDSGTEDGEGRLSVDFEEEDGPGTSTEGKQSCSGSERSKKKPKTSVVNVLQNLLEVTRKDMRAADERVWLNLL